MRKSESMGSLLGTLSISQVDALIQEEILKKQGYKFFFSIDADELNNYAYPLGLEGKRLEERRLNYEYITDEQISLFSLFNKKDFRAFLFEEHFDEIAQLINKIKYLNSQGQKIVDTVSLLLKRLNSETGKNLNEIKDKIEIIRENISLILSIAVGLQADGVDKLYKLRRERKLYYNEQDFFDEFLSEKIFDLDLLSPNNKFVDYLYNFLKEKSTIDSEIAILRRNISYYRDCRAIERVFSINKFLNSMNSKTIVLYLSSDFKTQNMFYKKSDNFSEPYNFLVEASIIVNKEKINYHRNTAQIFLRLLCEESTYDKVIKNLEQVKKVILIREIRERIVNSEGKNLVLSNELDRFFSEKIDTIRRQYEDYSTVIRIDKFKSLIHTLGEKDTFSKDLVTIPMILEHLLKEQESSQVKWRNQVDILLTELSQLNIFRNSVVYSLLDRVINKQLTSDIIQSLETGDDYVFGVDHHLPTFFIDDEEQTEPSFVKIVEHYNDSNENLKTFIHDFATRLFGNSQYMDELIVKRCILLLMLSNSRYEGREIMNYLKEFLGKYDYSNSSQASNFAYLFTWVLRRTKDFSGSIKVSNSSLREFDNDPRFYHSLALNKYCQFEDTKNADIDLIKEAINDSLSAIDLYREILNKKDYSRNSKKFINQNLNGVLNTFAYLNALGYSYNKRKFTRSNLKDARRYLDELKSRDEAYYDKPEFLHTESFLELQEFRAEKKIHKLKRALEAINLALLKTYMPVKLREMCIRLRDDIYKTTN